MKRGKIIFFANEEDGERTPPDDSSNETNNENTSEDGEHPFGDPRFTRAGNIDADAVRLAEQIEGEPTLLIKGFGNREFDVVTERYIVQTTNSQNVIDNPNNFLSATHRAEMEATFQAAKETNRVPVFNYTAGTPDWRVRCGAVEFLDTTRSEYSRGCERKRR